MNVRVPDMRSKYDVGYFYIIQKVQLKLDYAYNMICVLE